MPRQSTAARLARRDKSTASGKDVASRGGSSNNSGEAKTAVMSLRFSVPGLVERIDAAREAESVPLSRNAWIMRSLVNELERQGA